MLAVVALSSKGAEGLGYTRKKYDKLRKIPGSWIQIILKIHRALATTF